MCFGRSPKQRKGALGSMKSTLLPHQSHHTDLLSPSPQPDKRTSYCHADDALLPISRLIVQLFRQLGDSCRDGFVEHSVLPLIYVTCSNYHLHSSALQ